MSTGTLNGISCLSVAVHLPVWGLWWADCELEQESTLSGAVTLVLADLNLKGTVVSGGSWLGRSRYRIVGGAGGWAKHLPPKGYANAVGVRASKIIVDAATECGEQVENAPTGNVGEAFDRLDGPASQVLNLISPQSWYVGEDGITRFGRRAGKPVAASVTRGKVDFAAGSIELMSDELAGLLPGCVCDGMTAVDVVHRLDSKKLRTTLYGSSFGPTTKRLLAWSKLIEQMRPFERYRGQWEYRVVMQHADRLDLQPATTRFGLPDLLSVRVRYGLPGVRAQVALGSLVLVAFVNADPSRPVVVAFDDPESPGFIPQKIEVDASVRINVGGTNALAQAAGVQESLDTVKDKLNAIVTLLTYVPPDTSKAVMTVPILTLPPVLSLSANPTGKVFGS